MKEHSRRRYDTSELVGQIRRERRHGVLLALGAAGLMVVLLALYVGGLSGTEVPEVPEDGSTLPVPPRPPDPNAARAAEDEPEDEATATDTDEARAASEHASEPKQAQPATTSPARVRMVATRPTVLSVDGKRVAMGKKQSFQIPPGKHTLEARVKRRVFRRAATFAAGHQYMVRVDATKKKILVKRLD